MENYLRRFFQEFSDETDTSVLPSDIEMIAKKTPRFLELTEKYYPFAETTYHIHGIKPVIQIQVNDPRPKAKGQKIIMYKFTVDTRSNFIVYMKSGQGYLTNDQADKNKENVIMTEEEIFEKLKKYELVQKYKQATPVKVPETNVPSFADIIKEQEKEKEENSKCQICERTNHKTRDCRSPKKCKYTPCVSGDHPHAHNKDECSRVKN